MDGVTQGEGRRRKRTFSQEFRDEVIECCQRLGVSVAAVARAYDLHPNLLRRWVAERERSEQFAESPRNEPLPSEPQADRGKPQGAFLPLGIGTPPMSSVAQAQDIRIELRHHGMTAHITWPITAAEECAAWLQRLMK
jgi:Transposase and inactivated derivatives